MLHRRTLSGTSLFRPLTVRPRLAAGLALHAGDPLARGRFRVLSCVHADRHWVELLARETAAERDVLVDVAIARDDESVRALEASEHAIGSENDATRLRLLRDARIAATLTGRHVSRVLAAGVTVDGHPYVVREREVISTLGAVLAERPPAETEHAVDIALDVCEALAEAHAKGLVHTAVSTQSIRLVWTDAGPANVKLCGLGTARARAELGARLAITTDALIERAPELLRTGAPFDARADVWGVGAVLYRLLAGAPAFAAETQSGVDVAVREEDPPWLAGVPEHLAMLVESCLARDPHARPRSIAALAEALAPFASASRAATLDRIREHAKASIDIAIDAPGLELVVEEEDPERKEPQRASSTPTVPPLSVTVRPPATLVPTRQEAPRSRVGVLLAAAAFSVLAIAGAFLMTRPQSPAAGDAKQQASEIPTATIATTQVPTIASTETATPTATATPSAAATATTTTTTTTTPTTTTTTAAAATASGSAHAKGRKHGPAASAAPTVSATTPAPRSAEPETHEDDLRKFLDDRR